MKNSFFSGIARIAPVVLTLGLFACTSNAPAPVVGRGVPVQTTQAEGLYVVKGGDTLYSIAREYGMDHRELIALNGIENPDQIAVGRVLKIRPATPGAAITAPVTSGVVVARPIGDVPVVEKRLEPAAETADADKRKREPKAGKEPYSEQALAAARADGQAKAGATKPEVAAAPQAPAPAPAAAAPAAAAPAAGGWIWPASGQVIATFNESGNKGIDITGKAGDPVVAAGGGRVVYSGTGLRGYGKLVIIKHDATYLSAYAHNQNILVKEGQSVTRGQKIAEMGNTDADRVKLHFEIRRQGKPIDPLTHLPRR
ncbi:MAG: peptidoglycan DD-metalloendopeptidase family protein [Candidatus Accumulibacter sp.]|jgi:lipoprotein NlpD|nr:peptidoglycan DD-metalloendopeptidase family protein [Accumulibacter sp.]